MKFTNGIFFAAAIALAGCDHAPAGDSWKISKGDSLPEFSLTASDGTSFTRKDLEGKPTYVAVFATWCPPCKEELKALQSEVWPQFQKDGGQIIAVSEGEDLETVKDYVEREGLTFPVVVDENKQFTGQLGGSFVPRSVVVDKKGIIKHLHGGYSADVLAEIKTELKELL